MDTPQQGLQSFIKLCLSTKDQKTAALLFDLFLTPEEKTDLGMRFLIVKDLLQAEKTQRQMAKDLNVSIAKITRGSNELKRMSRKLLVYIKANLLGEE